MIIVFVTVNIEFYVENAKLLRRICLEICKYMKQCVRDVNLEYLWLQIWN